MPSAKQHTNIRLDAGILAEIDGLAQQQDRSRSYMSNKPSSPVSMYYRVRHGEN
jgi:hypothetical protein